MEKFRKKIQIFKNLGHFWAKVARNGQKIGKNWLENCKKCMSKWARILGILGIFFCNFF